MKNLLGPAIALMLAAYAVAGAQTASWKSVAPPGFNSFTGGIDFPTRDTGYAVASPSDIVTSTSWFLTSTNRGESWTTKAVEGVYLYDLKFADPKHGYAVGFNTGCLCGVMYSTADAGATWTPQTYPSTSGLQSLCFVDANTGFAAGASGMLLKTTNGGKNWAAIAVNSASDIRFSKVFFVTPTTGYMIGSMPSRDWANLIYKTTDGGATWTKIVDNGDDTQTKPTYSSMFFTSADTGYVTGREGSTKTIYKTINGGTTFTKSFTSIAAGDLFSMGGIQFITPAIGYASGDEGTIVRTTNGGTTWKQENSGVNTALPAMKFLDENTGFVGGLFGALLKRSLPQQPTAMISASELDFGTVDSGSKELTLTIQATNELGLRIDSIYIQNPPGKVNGFTVVSPTGPFPITLQQGNPLTVTVRFAPDGSDETDVRSDLAFKTNDPTRANIYVALLAVQGNPLMPAAQVSTTQLDFGNVAATASKDLSFTLGAANAAGLRIDSIALVDPGATHPFTLVAPTGPFPIAVDMAAPLTFTVRFAPDAAGLTAQSRLEIRTNDPSNTNIAVALMGKGITAPASVLDNGNAAMRLRVAAQPNPVAGRSQLTVNVPVTGPLTVELYDILGYRVAELYSAQCPAGALMLPFERGQLANGFYYCIATAGEHTAYCEITIAR